MLAVLPLTLVCFGIVAMLVISRFCFTMVVMVRTIRGILQWAEYQAPPVDRGAPIGPSIGLKHDT
jgi:hypothetical protein